MQPLNAVTPWRYPGAGLSDRLTSRCVMNTECRNTVNPGKIAMNRVKNILVAAGQFPQDDPVLARAAEIARAHRARLTLVHVIDSLTGFDYASTDLRRIQHHMRFVARASVETAVANQAGDVAGIDIRIETGSPALRLIELIDEIKADLVVMRAHQDDSIVEKIIGSTTDRVIRATGANVLVVKRPVARVYQRVVASIDTSDDSGSVVPFLAALFPSAALHLIHVVRIPPQFEAAMLSAGSGQDVVTHRDALVTKKLPRRPVRSTTRVVVGDPAISLVRATWSPKVDLIVLGPGDTGRIRRALLGSVARRVLRSAACDVLICRPVAQGAGD
jgi:nucleotide-binding universal stress UspA family protein